MSAAPGSVKKNVTLAENNEVLYDPYPGYVLTDGYGMQIPWPEWSDADLNAETWGEFKKKVSASPDEPSSSEFYEDSRPPTCPPFVEELVVSWKRPQEVFPDTKLIVFDPANDHFKLSIPSKIVNHEFFAHLMQVLPILQYYVREREFLVEWETPNFVANTQGQMWRPWHHVYALCKAGKGQVHKPMYSVYGKYVLRLYYMGGWRRFEVDDKIPCDKYGLCMLPTTQVRGELWPILLTKALLKVVALTRAKNFGLIDFPIITFFTGWMKETQNVLKKTNEETWRRISVLVPHYQLPEKEIDTKVIPKYPTSKEGSKASKASKASAKKKEPNPEFCFVLGVITGQPDEESAYPFAVVMIRDIPLVKATRKERIKPWKRIRWAEWASEKGLWVDELKLPPYRRIQLITFAKAMVKHFLPDPKHEAAIFDVLIEDESASGDQLSSTGHSKLYDPKQWLDFNKLLGHLSNLNIYFKPSSFPSSLKVTSVKKDMSKNEVPKKVPENLGSAPLTRRDTHFESYKLRPSGNQPLYLLCESDTSIFLQISLSVCPVSGRLVTGYLDEAHPEVLAVGKATLIIEKFDWTSPIQGEIVGMGRTVGHSSFSLNLRAGRHVFKMWTNTDSPFVVQLHSNGDLFLGKGYPLRARMGLEPVLIVNYINKVSAAFVSLVQSFGKPDLRSARRDFYRAILPGNSLLIGYRFKLDDFIDTFLLCILITVKTLVPNLDELRIIQGALQSLFVNPKIVCDLPPGLPPLSIYAKAKRTARKPPPPRKMKPVVEAHSDISYGNFEKVVKIQKVYRGYRARLLLKCQTPARIEFKPYGERLKKVSDLIFSPTKRDEAVGRLIRQVVVTNPSLKETFRFHEDFLNVCQVDTFTGKIPNVEPRIWIPITRFIIANHGNEPMPCCVYVSCNLEQFFVLSIDNDTGEELFRLSNSASPKYYKNNDNGYTIFVFGWNELVVKTVNWRLEMVRMKHFPEPHICNKLVDFYCNSNSLIPFRLFEVKNFYVPNHKSRICRCHIKIQRRCLLTLRLSISCPFARFFLTISLGNRVGHPDVEFGPEDERLIIRTYSVRGAVLLPAVILDCFDRTESSLESDGTLYVLEALVIDDSWPLTKQEWGTVEHIRVNGENWGDSSSSLLSRKGASESRRKIPRTKKYANEARPIDNPYWLLQVLLDAHDKPDPTDFVVIEEDKSYAESVKAMKISWEEEQPGRRKNGRELRLNFLREMYTATFTGLPAGEDEDMDRESDEFSLMLNRLSYFSYLTADESTERYNKSPRYFPKMPTQKLLDEYKKQNIALPLEDDIAELWPGSLTRTSIISWERRSDYLNKYVRWRYILESYFEKEQMISKQLKEQGYERRLKAMERLGR